MHGQDPRREDVHAGKLHEHAQAMIFHVILFRAVVTIGYNTVVSVHRN